MEADSMQDRNINSLVIPRLLIGAPQGRSGKTTITLGLLRLLHRNGYKVQPYKKGPDFIDPSWHSAAARRPSRNLDSFMMSREEVCRSLAMHSSDCHYSIIEGAMGLFDGLDLLGSSSTAEIAKITASPVLLVIDATRITRSTAAIVMGCQHFDKDITIVGVILNKIARSRHEKIAREAIESYCHIPVIGAIPKDSELAIPDRHLGLVTQGEIEDTHIFLEKLAEIMENHVDLDRVKKMAEEAPPLPIDASVIMDRPRINIRSELEGLPKIGVVRDLSFSFYYPENIEAIERAGAEIVFLSALQDEHLPLDLDALYIGGGFPEIFAKQLAQNSSLREEIRLAAENELPIYAECGGLMYLGRTIINDSQAYDMVGLLPFDSIMEAKPQGHGYTIMKATSENGWFEMTQVRGHEFHNSNVINLDPEKITFGFEVERGRGIDGKHDGICYKEVFAAYNHIHALGTPEWATKLVTKAERHRVQRNAITNADITKT